MNSGFLHQLAARSLGLAPQVKPRAVLPYAATAPLSDSAEISNLDPAEVRAVSMNPTPTADRLPQPLRPLDGERAASRTTSSDAVPTERNGGDNWRAQQSSPTRAPAPASAPSPRNEPPPETPVGYRAARHEQRPEPISSTDHSPTTLIRGRHEPPLRHTSGTDEIPDPSATPLPDQESLVTRLFKDEARTNEVTKLEPVTHRGDATAKIRPVEAATTARSTTFHPANAIQQTADAAPEVHITIGRLEVNAPSKPNLPPQPSVPPRPRGPSPLSLNDYLARRNGGRS